MNWMISSNLIFFDALVFTVIVWILVQIMTSHDVMLEPIEVLHLWFLLFSCFLFFDLCLLIGFLLSLFSFLLFILLGLLNLFFGFTIVAATGFKIFAVFVFGVFGFYFSSCWSTFCFSFFSDLPSISFFLLEHFPFSLFLFIILKLFCFTILNPTDFILFLFFSCSQLRNSHRVLQFWSVQLRHLKFRFLVWHLSFTFKFKFQLIKFNCFKNLFYL